MRYLALYIFLFFFFLVFVFIFLIWATVIKMSFPTWKKAWFLSKENKFEAPAKNIAHADKGYDCVRCGAALSKNADVSPSGDIKCQYCNKWFNIHRSGND